MWACELKMRTSCTHKQPVEMRHTKIDVLIPLFVPKKLEILFSNVLSKSFALNNVGNDAYFK